MIANLFADYRLVLLAVILLSAGSAAQAQASVDPAAGSFEAVDHVLASIVSGINTFSVGQPFLALGKKIAVTLFGVILIWGIIKNWVTGKGFVQLVGDIMQPLVLLSITLFAVERGLGVAIKDSILGLADVLASAVGASVGGMEVRMMQAFAFAGFKILELEVQSSFWESFSTALSTFSGGAVAFIFGWLVKVIAGVAMILAGAISAAIILVAKISIALAIVMAPVMIPWGMWRPTEFLFSAWMRFLIVAAMQIVVVAALGGILSGAVDAIAALSATYTSNSASIALSSSLILFAILTLYIMMQAPSLASGLISGDGSIGLRGWTAAASSAHRGVTGLGGSATNSFKAGAKTAQGLYKGYKAVRSGRSANGTQGAAGQNQGGTP